MLDIIFNSKLNESECIKWNIFDYYGSWRFGAKTKHYLTLVVTPGKGYLSSKMRYEELIEVNLYKVLGVQFNAPAKAITAGFKVWLNIN